MTRVLLTGADGRFGRDFVTWLGQHYELFPLTLQTCDIRDLAAVRAAVRQVHPEVVLHAAAYTDVDGAETAADEAFAVNAVGSRNVAMAAEEAGAWLVAISSDYVFSGRLDRPYHEFDPPSPVSVYGQSKLAGEQAVAAYCRRHTIVRTAWLYANTGPCFPRSIIRRLQESVGSGQPVPVVADQRGNPTSTRVLADLVHRLIRDPIPGIVHGSCEGAASWFEFAREIQFALHLPGELVACATEDIPRPASRPRNSALDKMALRLAGRPPLPVWPDALKVWIRENRDEFV
jgi:dTDP-4-dehydrorhamnose reductase